MARLIEITGKAMSGEWGNDDLTGEGIPVLRTTNFTNEGLVNYANVVTRDLGKKDVSKKYLRPGDIIIEKSGGSDNQPVGRVIYFDGPESTYLFNNFTGLLRVNDTQTWISRYVFYALFANYQFGGTRCYENRTTGLHNLKTDAYVSSVEIKDLSFKEQRKIVETLDKLTDLISLRKQQLTKLDELVKTRFVEMFGDPCINPKNWPQKRFDSVCENLDSQRIPITASDRKQGIYPYYGASGIVDYVDSYIFDEDILLISEDGANLVARVTPIAFSVSGKVWVNNHAHVVRFERKCTQIYIEHYFTFIDISDCITGTAQPKLNQAKLNAMMIPIPDMNLQGIFSNFVEKTFLLKLTIQQSLDKLEVLKKALMQEYFG